MSNKCGKIVMGQVGVDTSNLNIATFQPRSIVIGCDKIVLAQNSIGIDIDVTLSLEHFDTIIINGVEFTRRINDG